MTPSTFRFEEKDGVGTLTLDRPATLNSLTFEVYDELVRFFAWLAGAASPRALVVTGAGRGFCSGGDVSAIIGELFSRDAAGLHAFTRTTCDVVRNMRACGKPVIAAVNGTAAGAGAVIALASDVRIFSASAKIAFLFVKVGLAGADMGAAALLPRVVGLGRASELLMTGRMVEAAEAERIGLANRVVAPEALLEEAHALARSLAAGPGFALGMTKELLDREAPLDLGAALSIEAAAQAFCMTHRDFREAHDAWKEKRAPRFGPPAR
jgi:enoyl-CoA hydratase/carnithine racemase